MAAAYAFAAPSARFVHISITGVINPIKARYVAQAIDLAEHDHAQFLLVTINTPGGLVSSMEEICSDFTNAPIPVVGYVEPPTAEATSAGSYILLATDVAAMAPGTRVGAAHPVANGKPLEGELDKKATNSLVALAKSLAARHGRSESFAEKIVRESASYTAKEALALHAVEIIAPNETDLLRQLDGRTLVHGGRRITLSTRDLTRVELPMSAPERFLDEIADPTIASMLLTLGVLGVLYELASPGIGMAGIVGVASLLLGFTAMSVLPIDLGGLLLLGAGFAAIFVEIKVPSHGLVALGGVGSIVLGALLLVDEARYFGAAQHIEWRVFGPFTAVVIAGFFLMVTIASRALRQRFQTGIEAMSGMHGVVKAPIATSAEGFSGSVFVDGARWRAVASEEIAAGETVEVVEVLAHPTRLRVERSQRRKEAPDG